MGSCYVTQGASQMLCDDPEGWDGGGRDAQVGGDTCIMMADLCCFTAETITTL